jgi:antitoxin Phd
MLVMPSVQAQNGFGHLLDAAQRQIISITRRGRTTAYVMSPDVLQDYVDAQLALAAEAEGFASDAEVTSFLHTLKDA